MKKKILIVICVLLLIISESVSVYASEIVPLYNKITAVQSTMGIDGNELHYTVKVLVPSTDTLDSVHINAKLKTIGGAVKATYDEDLDMFGSMFYFSKNKTVVSSGTYYLDYTVTCFKEGAIVDKVSKTTVTATY